MSAITENPSIISRGRASSRHLRSYQKISEANLDERAVVTYLKKHHFHRTITTFMSESHFQNNIQPIIQIIERGGIEFQGQVSQIVNHIRVQTTKKGKINAQKELTVQLFLYIWFCIEGQHLNKSRINILKQFINKKGQKLSQIPQLLPYFALPYANEPNSHHFLQKIFTNEWKEDLKAMIMDVAGKKTEQKKEQEWLNIVQDMIEICTELFKHIDAKKRNVALQSMVQRVNLYKFVIEKNKKLHERCSKSVQEKVKQINMNNVQQIKQRLSELQDNVERSTLFHKIQMELIALQKFKQDKKYVKQLIDHDILDLQHRKIQKMQYEEFKLMQMLSSYHQGRNYIEKYPHYISHFTNIIESHSNLKHISKHDLLLLECIIDIISKLIIRKSVFRSILSMDGSISLFISIFQKFKSIYLKGNKSIELTLTVISNLLTNLVMQNQGRQIIAKTMYFESLIDFISKVKKEPLNEKLQKVICSSIYLLLMCLPIRKQAKRLRVKDLLLDRMAVSHNEGYENIVGFIIERIEDDGQIEEGDSDQDVEKSLQFDSNIRIRQDVVYHKGQSVHLNSGKENSPKKQINQDSSVEKDRKKSRSKRSLHQPTQNRPYFRDKYVRKSQEPKNS